MALALPAFPGACVGSRGATADTYAVYAAALDSFAPIIGRAPSHLLRVRARTWAYALRPAFGDTSVLYRGVRDDSGVGEALLDAYDLANARPEALCDCFPVGRRVELVSPPWTSGPSTPIALSAVAFNAARARPLVMVGRPCGDMCSYEVLYLIVRRGARWEVSRRVLGGTS